MFTKQDNIMFQLSLYSHASCKYQRSKACSLWFPVTSSQILGDSLAAVSQACQSCEVVAVVMPQYQLTQL